MCIAPEAFCSVHTRADESRGCSGSVISIEKKSSGDNRGFGYHNDLIFILLDHLAPVKRSFLRRFKVVFKVF